MNNFFLIGHLKFDFVHHTHQSKIERETGALLVFCYRCCSAGRRVNCQKIGDDLLRNLFFFCNSAIISTSFEGLGLVEGEAGGFYF
jgi:hypothetical protein